MKKKKIAALTTALALIVTMIPTTFVSAAGSGDFTADGSVLTGFNGNDSMVVPDTVNGIHITGIKDHMCENRKDINYVDTSNVNTIGDYAFKGSSIMALELRSAAKKVGKYAFADCSKLEYIYFNSSDVVLGEKALAGTGHIVLNIPCISDVSTLLNKVKDAKLDTNYEYELSHRYVASETEKDQYGFPVVRCEDCGIGAPEDNYGDEGPDGPDYNEEMPFKDVDFNAWYHSYVRVAYELGIINGKSAEKFDPNANMTLAEAAKIAAMINKKQKGENTYIEPTGTRWYDAYVDYCFENGIIEYSKKSEFDWTKPATRGQMAYLFSRADILDYVINPDVPLTDIPDVNSATPYAYEILDLYREGIASGSDEKYTFYPDRNIKRSEVSALIARIIIEDMRIELPKG